MRTVNREERFRVGGGVQAVPALPGSVVTQELLMGSWTPWTFAIGAFAGGFAVGTYIYDNFDTEILDAIEAVVD